MRTLLTLTLSVLLAAAAAQLGAQSRSSVSVAIRTFQFAPETLRVAVGRRVVWMNEDEIEHTVTAGTPAERDAAFSAVLAGRGASAERAFDRTGTFTYFCDRHQFMRGSITITR